jgi:hypothetical protein
MKAAEAGLELSEKPPGCKKNENTVTIVSTKTLDDTL